MRTAYVSHPDCQKHDTGAGHPENARRLAAIEDQFVASRFYDVLHRVDAHRDDEMSNVSLTDADDRWVTEQIVNVASSSASNRIVSALEGGYELHSLARCVEIHLRVLAGLD